MILKRVIHGVDKASMDQIENGLRPQLRALDFMQARHWAGKAEKTDYDQTWADLLNHEFGDNVLESIDLLSKPGLRLHGPQQKRAHRVMRGLTRPGKSARARCLRESNRAPSDINHCAQANPRAR